MAIIKKNHLVTKRNVLNELRATSMTLQELRFFSIYLSRINPKDMETRVVRFPLDDFQAIMDLGRININYLKEVTNSLLSKIVNVPTERGGYSAFQLFKKCTVDVDDIGEWYIEINAHDEALPLMFDFKNKFFSYELWNALRLKSPNQLKMYEFLKQYEKVGYRVFTIENLRKDLGIKKEEYPRFGNFKTRVLDASQKALEENTDISFTYEPHGRKGAGGKILALKFNIHKNNNFVDPLMLDDFIEQHKLEESEPISKYQQRIDFISDACDNEFSSAEMELLYNIIMDKFSYTNTSDDVWCYHYMRRKYNELKIRDEKTKIKHRFSYLKKIIEVDEELY